MAPWVAAWVDPPRLRFHREWYLRMERVDHPRLRFHLLFHLRLERLDSPRLRFHCLCHLRLAEAPMATAQSTNLQADIFPRTGCSTLHPTILCYCLVRFHTSASLCFRRTCCLSMVPCFRSIRPTSFPIGMLVFVQVESVDP